MPAWQFIVFIHCSEIEVTYRPIGQVHITIINRSLKYSCIAQVILVNNVLSYLILSYMQLDWCSQSAQIVFL